MEIKGEEAAYLMGANEPAKSSVLISNSRYLNNPRMRDIYAQMGLKRDSGDLPGAYLIPELNRAIAEEMDMPRLYELLAEEKARLPEFAQWLDAGFVSDWNACDLSGCAEGTVGATIRRFVEQSGMDIDFMFKDMPKDDFGYLLKRRVQNHDIEHMVTGLDPTPVGEIALIVANVVAISNYFIPEFAQMLSFQPLFLASTSLMRMNCHYPKAVPALLEGFALGYTLGMKQTKPLFMLRWEDHIHTAVSDVRRTLGFEDGPEPGAEHWNWTWDAAKG
ncbi:Coq4 family protein [Sphingobium aromaticivastans]|uniref:Coq4 family protein n=1 Tax=Sphingobium aromaticivastans TaxID=1778665 RepID=UPI0030180D6D